MVITKVISWKFLGGLSSLYDCCIPGEFEFHFSPSEEIGRGFVYDLNALCHYNPGRKIKPPTEHPVFGQMHELRVDSTVTEQGITLVHIKGINDRFDRWMEAIFAIQQKQNEGGIWAGKLIAFEHGAWYGYSKKGGYLSQWSRFNLIGFQVVEYKDITLTYEFSTLDKKGERYTEQRTIEVEFSKN